MPIAWINFVLGMMFLAVWAIAARIAMCPRRSDVHGLALRRRHS
jgi:hypothetical protein